LVVADPGELRPITDGPALSAERARFDAAFAREERAHRAARQAHSNTISLPEGVHNAFRRLGYIDDGSE